MLLATQYYRPPFPDRTRWAEDLRQIRDTGLEAIQIWATWAWLEPEPGRFVYDDVDELFEQAGQAGLKVIVNTIAELFPYWIHREVPDSRLVDHLGRPEQSATMSYSPVGLVPGGCPDNPRVRDLIGRFLTDIAGRYAGSGELLVWDCWNEVRVKEESAGYICYCDHTLAAWRDWLRRKYGTVDALSGAWHRRLSRWEDAPPGRGPGRSWVEIIEYCEFLSDRTAGLLSHRADSIRAADPDHPVIAHGLMPLPVRPSGQHEQPLLRGSDWELASRLDGFGVSQFPAWFARTPPEFGLRLETARSATGDRPFWVSELQGGAAGAGLKAMDPVPADLQQRWIWASYGRGAKAINFWCWRDEVFGRESGGFGVAGDDGHAERRLAALRDTTRVLRDHAGLLDGYRPDQVAVGVVYEPAAARMDFAMNGVEAGQAMDDAAGWIKTLERLQVPYDVLESAHLADLSPYRLLIVPWALVVRPEAAGALARWTEAGGTLVVESAVDAYSPLGFYRYPDERRFAARLGIRSRGRRPADAGTLPFAVDGITGSLPVAGWFEEFDGTGVEVLGASSHGPALVRRAAGSGTVVAVGLHAGLAGNGERSAGLESLLRTLVDAGAPATLRCDPDDGEVVQWRTGRSGERRLLFVTNDGEATTASFTGTADLFAGDLAEDLLTGATVKVTRQEGRASLTLSLAAGGSHVLCCPPPVSG